DIGVHLKLSPDNLNGFGRTFRGDDLNDGLEVAPARRLAVTLARPPYPTCGVIHEGVSSTRLHCDRSPAPHQLCRARARRHSERCGPPNWTASVLSALGARDQAFALSLFPGRLASSSDRLRFLAGLACGRLFIGLATLHLAKNALALHPLLQNSQSLIDIVIANEYLQMFSNRAAAALWSF